MDIESNDLSTDDELEKQDDEKPGDKKLLYSVDDAPSAHVTFFLALQQLMTNFSGTVTLPIILANILCINKNNEIKIRLISGMMMTSGISTWLIVTFGIRLPVFQGSNSIIIAPIIASAIKCPDLVEKNLSSNSTTQFTSEEDIFYDKIAEFQGALIMASLVEFFLGAAGLVGFIMRFVGPLTIAPIFFLIGPSLLDVCADYSGKSWAISLICMALIFTFSFIFGEKQFPLPSYKSGTGFSVIYYPLFQAMPIFLSVVFVWLLCGILTWTDVLPNDPSSGEYYARVDISTAVQDSPWLVFPYPGQWGIPKFKITTFIAFLVVILCSVLESIGDYVAIGEVCQASPIPKHALNRGIMMEGLGCMIGASMVGAGMTTSYSTSTGVVQITKVASRKVLQWAGIIEIILGFFGKFSAFMVGMPHPVIGGISLVGFGMVSSIGIAMIEHVNLKVSRNLCVLGLSLIMGLTLPGWISMKPNLVLTGNSDCDEIFVMLLKMPLFVAGVIAFILDNCLPGTLADRGMMNWCGSKDVKITKNKKIEHIYNIPYITKYLNRWRWTRFIPISPTSDPNYRRRLLRKRKSEKLKAQNNSKIYEKFL